MIPPKRLRDEQLDIPGEAEIGIKAVAAALPYAWIYPRKRPPLPNRKEREPQMTAQAAKPSKQEPRE